MAAIIGMGRRPEALADVPGIARMEFTGAVVRLTEARRLGGERADHTDLPSVKELGLAVVLEGGRPSRAKVVELGGCRLSEVDLTREVVVLDWVYDATLEHLGSLIEAGTPGAHAYAAQLAWEVLQRLGFGPLTRPIFLRMGFRDICQDLDLHEALALRLRHPTGGLIRVTMDFEGCCLQVHVPAPDEIAPLQEALSAAFPLRESQPISSGGSGGSTLLLLRFPVPLTLTEARGMMEEIRSGMERLFRRLEPQGAQGVEASVAAFGVRDSLARFDRTQTPPGGRRGDREGRSWLPASPPASRRVH